MLRLAALKRSDGRAAARVIPCESPAHRHAWQHALHMHGGIDFGPQLCEGAHMAEHRIASHAYYLLTHTSQFPLALWSPPPRVPPHVQVHTPTTTPTHADKHAHPSPLPPRAQTMHTHAPCDPCRSSTARSAASASSAANSTRSATLMAAASGCHSTCGMQQQRCLCAEAVAAP